jgi:hypothetical protein
MVEVRKMTEDHYIESITVSLFRITSALEDANRPSNVFKPKLFFDHTMNRWEARSWPEAGTRVTGIGSTPAEAMKAFDLAWHSGKAEELPLKKEVSTS